MGAAFMKVIEIGIADLRYDGAAARHTGHVSMAVKSDQNGLVTHMHFLCRSELMQDCCPTQLQDDLIADALRQANRMPGFRGVEQIELAQDVVSTRPA